MRISLTLAAVARSQIAVEEDCVLLPGVCDDNSHVKGGEVPETQTLSDSELQSIRARVDGKLYCYKTGDGNFLAYDPPLPDTSKIRHTQLPGSVQELQADWMASSFQFGEPCLATGEQDCPDGFNVNYDGLGVVNDAGNLYGGGSDSAPPHCGGCQEEVITCLSSARSVRNGCTVVPLDGAMQNFSSSQGSCGLAPYKHPWILRNRNLYANNNKKGTGKYFYMVTIQGFPCNIERGPQQILGLIKSFAQGFQGIIDIWRLKPACSGRCEMVSGAVSAWMTYSVPVALSILAQLRAWASLKVDDIEGCIGNQAVLKFGGVSVTDDGVVCCPEPHSGGRCNQNYQLPSGWRQKLTAGSDLDFATWLASVLGNGVGSCDRCGWPGPDKTGTMCPGAKFSYGDERCQPADYKNYIPGGGGPAPDPTPTPSPAPTPSPPPPQPSPSPSPAPPSAQCEVGDNVQCSSGGWCSGQQCCSDLSVCPSAPSTWSGCPKPKAYDCTGSMVTV